MILVVVIIVNVLIAFESASALFEGSTSNCTNFNPCKNMAECLRYDSEPNRVKCICHRGFNGNLCEIWPKICSEEFCFNGGTCVLIKRIPRCLCQPSFNGLFCERNSFQGSSDVAQPASSNYQILSSTVPTSTISYLTLHPSIYLTSNPNRPKQSICDFDPCLNFGQCMPITDRKSFFKFQCVCPEHYSGILCEKYAPPQPPLISSQPMAPYSTFAASMSSSPYTGQQQQPSVSFQYEQSTLDFLPELSTHTYTNQKNNGAEGIEKAQIKASSMLQSVEQTPTSTVTTPTIMTRTSLETNQATTTTTMLPAAPSISTERLQHKTQTKPFSISSSTTMGYSVLETKTPSLSTIAENNNHHYHYHNRYSICAQLRPCANNGRCIDNENSLDGMPRFKCICRPEFTGVFCHIRLSRRPNACVFNLCLNSGECIPNPELNSFTCNCPPNFTGKYCELNSY